MVEEAKQEEPKESKRPTVHLSQEQLDKMRSVVDNATADFIEHLPNLLKTRLEENVANMLGFEIDGGKWKVKRDNYHTVGKFISEKTNKILNDLVGKVEAEITEDQIKAIKQELQTTLKREITNGMRHRIEQASKKVLESVIVGLELEPVKMAKDEKEAADPKYGETRLEKIALWELWQKEANGKK